MNSDPNGTAIATPLATPMAKRWPEDGSAYCHLPTASSTKGEPPPTSPSQQDVPPLGGVGAEWIPIADEMEHIQQEASYLHDRLSYLRNRYRALQRDLEEL